MNKLVSFEEDIKDYKDNIKFLNENSEVNCIDHLNIEKQLYFDNLNNSNIHINKSKISEDLDLDIFNLLFKQNPVIKSLDRMKSTHVINNKLLRIFTDSPKFNELKYKTTLNSNSSFSALTIVKELLEKSSSELLKKMDELNKEMNNVDEIQNKIDGINNIIPSLNAKDNGNLLRSLAMNRKNLINTLKRKKSSLTNIEQQLENEFNKLTNSDNFDEVISETNDEVELIDNFANVCNINDPKDLNNFEKIDENSLSSLRELISNSNFDKLMILLGSMCAESVKFAKKKKSKTGYIPNDVIVSNDIASILNSQKTLLSNNITKKLFYKNFIESKLLSYEYLEEKNKGPIIICRDISGSMIDTLNIWSIAFIISILQSAKIQKRNLEIINFNDSINVYNYNPKKNKSLKAIFDICVQKPCNGTNFSLPLKKAFETIDNTKFKEASILFITDGESYIPEKTMDNFLKLKRIKEVFMYTVYIGNAKENSQLNKLSTKSYRIDLSELTNYKHCNNVSTDIFKCIT